MKALPSQRLARLTAGSRWLEIAVADRTRLRTAVRAPTWVRAGSYSAALWSEQHQVTVRCVPTRPRTSSSPTEIAFALAGLSGAPLYMGELILLDDQSVRPALLAEAEPIARRMPWKKKPGAETLRDLVNLAILEVEHHAEPLSQRMRARALGIHQETYRRAYASVYESQLYPTVGSWSFIMLEHVSRRL